MEEEIFKKDVQQLGSWTKEESIGEHLRRRLRDMKHPVRIVKCDQKKESIRVFS